MKRKKGYSLYNQDGAYGVVDNFTKHITLRPTLEDANELLKLLRKEQASRTKLLKGVR